MKTVLYSAVGAMALLALTPVEAASVKLLSEAQMRKLAVAGVRATAPGALRRPIGLERSNRSGYAWFEGWANVGQGHVGLYVIDPRTGDMWDGVSECGAITSPEIRALQRKLRKTLGLSNSEYRRIRRAGPMCE
jgi:hypothetical protein